MKRIFINLAIAMTFMFSFASCETYVNATTQDDIYTDYNDDIVRVDVDYNVVIRFGTPYYYQGSILYYIYNGLYYYPFYYNNYWYIRAYRRPFDHLHYRPYFRPHRYDYRFGRGYRPTHKWINHNRYNRPTPRPGNRPNINNRRPNDRNNRPIGIDRRPNNNSRGNINSTPQTRPNNRPQGGFGGGSRPSGTNRSSGGGRFGGRR